MNKNHSETNAKEKTSFFDRIRKEREELSPDEPRVLDNPTIGNFFKLLGRKINTLLYVNLLYIFSNFPIFFGLFALTGYTSTQTYTPYYQQYIPLLGVSYLNPSPVTASLLGIFGIHDDVSVPTVITYILFGLTLLVFLTFGLSNVGTTHLLRSMVREEGMFLWSDFWYAIRKNWKQGLVFGVIDLLIMGLLSYDFIYFYINLASESMMIYIMFFMTFAMGIVYFMMRLYIYPMMITFDLSIFKLMKNGLFFTILGIKRNIMALLGIVLIVAINYTLLIVFFPLGVILPFILLFSVGGLIGMYAAYPKIKEIMIDPYYDEHGNPKKQPKSSPEAAE